MTSNPILTQEATQEYSTLYITFDNQTGGFQCVCVCGGVFVQVQSNPSWNYIVGPCYETVFYHTILLKDGSL